MGKFGQRSGAGRELGILVSVELGVLALVSLEAIHKRSVISLHKTSSRWRKPLAEHPKNMYITACKI